jgi:hypothetical protein
MGAVLDNNQLLSEKIELKESSQRYDRKAGFVSSFRNAAYFNSGVIYCKDVPICYDFFNEWHKLWHEGRLKNITQDQPSFNQVNFIFNNILTQLDGVWNYQIEYGSISYLRNSKIIHYFSHMKYNKICLLANTEIFKDIRKNGITEEIRETLKNIRTAFSDKTRLIADEESLNIFNSKLFRVCRKSHTLLIFLELPLTIFFYIRRLIRRVL